LWRKTTLQVVLLDDALFSKALRSKAEKELTKAAVAAERARWAAFGLAPPDADPARNLLGVLDEQVAGFYDPSSKALTVREKPPGSAGASADASSSCSRTRSSTRCRTSTSGSPTWRSFRTT